MLSTSFKALCRAACVLAIAGPLGLLPAGFATAQTRAALVKNIDEPGRIPYRALISFRPYFGCLTDCSNYHGQDGVFLVDGPVVPAGKRLVVQWVSGEVPGTDSYALVDFQSAQNELSYLNLTWRFAGPFFPAEPGAGGGGRFRFSTAAHVLIEPGQSPHLRVQVNGTSPLGSAFFAVIAVSGYLIDAGN